MFLQTIYKYENISIKLLLPFLLCLCSILQTSCKKGLVIDPPFDTPVGEKVFSTNSSAAGVLTGLYSVLAQNGVMTGSTESISLTGGLSADEFALHPNANAIYKVRYTNALARGDNYWAAIYSNIYNVNAAIEGLSNSTTLTPSVKQQLLGEAKFLRAFFYFYLVNLFGDVPLITTTNYKVDALAARTSKDLVYEQIVADLTDAQSLLSVGYLAANVVDASNDRVRPTKAAATAMLSRVYLYLGQWSKAEMQASSLINNTTSYSLVTDPNAVFIKNSTEAIWQLQPVNPGWNTEDARFFILTGAPDPFSKPVYLSNFLLSGFEVGDLRKINWTGYVTANSVTYYFANKYKVATQNEPVTEYLMVLRLAEQYLIRAEARAQQDNIAGAKEDLNAIRTRAGLANTVANDRTSLLTAILHERQVELFTEWGHRWFDLKRTGNIDAVMGAPGGVCAAKGGTWSSYKALFPIPQADMNKNPNLVQNTGY